MSIRANDGGDVSIIPSERGVASVSVSPTKGGPFITGMPYDLCELRSPLCKYILNGLTQFKTFIT